MNRPIPQQILTTLLVVVCIVFNLVAQTFPLRLDLSNGKAYSVSESSKGIIKGLKKPVTITFFVSRNIPSSLQSVRTEIDTFLTEYSNQTGKNKIAYRQIDPEANSAAQKEVQKYTIPRLQFSQQDQDVFSLQNAYFGVGVEYGGRHASLPQVTDIRDLEYNLTAILYTLGKTSLPTVGIYGLPSSTSTLQSLFSASRLQFSLKDAPAIDSSNRALLIFADGTKEYTADEIGKFSSYLKSGGSVIIFADGVNVDTELSAVPAKHNLYQFLKNIGATLHQDLVLSQAAELISFGQSQSALPTILQYPFWIKTNEFAKDSKVSNISSLVFPWASSIIPSSKFKTIVSSESQSWTQEKDFSVRPDQAAGVRPQSRGQYPLVVESKYGNGHVMIISSSKFIQDTYLSRSNDNLELVLNTLNEYVSEGALTGIRRRSVEYHPLPALDTTTKNLLKYAQIGLGSLMVVIAGVVILVRRNRKQSA